VILGNSVGGQVYQTNTSANMTTMAPQALAIAGGSLPHNNMMPYLTLSFCIALQGVFPPRS
jgi:microcystin-dependent protein